MQKITESPRVRAIEQKLGTPLPKLFHKWHWGNNLKHKEIGSKLGVPRPTITRWFHQFDVPSQPCTRFTNLNLLNTGPRKTLPAKPKVIKPRQWKIHDEFFDEWSSEMAYVLGFVAADGYIFVNPRGSHYLAIQITDGDLLQELKKLLGTGHKLTVRKGGKVNWKKRWSLQIGSKKIFNRLVQLGITPRKTNHIRMPEVPHKYLADFIRGYFDGDGGVWYGFIHKNDRKRPSRTLKTTFTSGSKGMLIDVANSLVESAGTKEKRPTFSGRAFRLQYSAFDSSKIYNFMYHAGANLYLKRKKVIFEKYLGT